METKDNLEATAAPASGEVTPAKAKPQTPAEAAAAKKAAMAAAVAAQQAITGSHQEHIQEALELLYKHFPKAFIKEGDCKPLKVGILDDLKPLIADIPGLSISKVRAAVRFYTSRLRYFFAMREGAMRIDLEGNEVEPVTSEHAEYAHGRFTEINAKRRPAKPKRPAPKGGKPGMRRGAGKPGQAGAGAPHGKGPQGNNRRPGGPNRGNAPHTPRHYDPLPESEVVIGRAVTVQLDRAYVRATISEAPQGDKVKVTMQNGVTASVPVARLFQAPPAAKHGGNGGHGQGFNRGGRDNHRGNGGGGRGNFRGNRGNGPRGGGNGGQRNGGKPQGNGPRGGANGPRNGGNGGNAGTGGNGGKPNAEA